MPVIVPYLQTLHLSMSQVLQLQAIFCLAVALLEVPTGYVADLWGRKCSLLIGGFINGCAFSMLPFAHTFEGLALFQVVVALGCALESGADIALVYESLPEDSNRTKMLGRVGQWSLIGEAVASLCAAVLVSYSFSAVVWAQVVVGWMPFVLSFWFIEPQREKLKNGTHFRNIVEVFQYLFFGCSLMRIIFFNCVVWGLSTFIVVWLLQPYWISHAVPLSWFGPMWTVLMLTSAFCSRSAHSIEARFGASTTLLLVAVASCAGYFMMSSNIALLGVPAALLFYVSRGVSSVVLVDAFNWKTPSAFRATANSFNSLSFRLSFAVIGPIVGWSVDSVSLPTTLFLVGSIFAVLLVILMFPLCRRIEQLRVKYIPA
jgi:MFS family permease